jgi:signal recognition particle subunit SEC65
VKAEEIVHAARELGLNPNLRAEAAHPRRPRLKLGAVIVDKKGSKSQVLEDVARMIHDKPRKK